ncbi:Cell division control protein 7 [Rhodotorula toruloides]
MTATAPLVQGHALNVPTHQRVTRSASNLRKQIQPSSANSDDDDSMHDEVVLAPLPSRSQDDQLSSQTRRQLARPGSSALDERVSDAEGVAGQALAEAGHGRGSSWYGSQDESMEADGAAGVEDEELEDEDDGEGEQEEEDSDAGDDSRSEGELQAIGAEMDALEQAVPGLLGKYHLTDRLGEGTFSSVYKAIDLQNRSFDNSQWKPVERKGKVYVAVKRIYVTSSPVRIHNELEILHDLRGAPNVAYLIDAIRHEDQVLAVMPFNRHQDFRTYYRTASLPLLRSYFCCLFRALTSTHQLQIIHRDVKPANFLYDVTTGTGVLCDYGLAQKIGGDEWFEWKSDCLHSLPGPSYGGLEGRARAQRKMEKNPNACPGLCSGLHGVRLAKPISLYEQAVAMENEWDMWDLKMRDKEDRGQTVTDEDWDALEAYKPWEMPPGWRSDIKRRIQERQEFYKSWRPALSVAAQKAKQKPGYLKEDRRPSVRANRAGTRGFRAPEVLLKCPDQTVALDIWSVGIILLCFLTRRFPFFNSNDDTEALAEITAIFGKRKMERCAALHNRTFQTNVPDYDSPPHGNLHALVKTLNPPIMVENSPDPYGPIPSPDEEINKWYPDSDLYQVVDLMKRCLELDCTKRWTSQECLEHPFFRGEYDIGLGRTVFRESAYAAIDNESST